jgi:hypothetical protein
VAEAKVVCIMGSKSATPPYCRGKYPLKKCAELQFSGYILYNGINYSKWWLAKNRSALDMAMIGWFAGSYSMFCDKQFSAVLLFRKWLKVKNGSLQYD